jgi:uncharacterized protein (TIGR02118 family)
MIKLVILYPWPSDPAHFKNHYVQTHVPLCRAIPGMTRAHYGFEPQKTHGPGRWFCVFEAEYPDLSSLQAALATPQARAAQEDVPKFSVEPPLSLICEARAL